MAAVWTSLPGCEADDRERLADAIERLVDCRELATTYQSRSRPPLRQVRNVSLCSMNCVFVLVTGRDGRRRQPRQALHHPLGREVLRALDLEAAADLEVRSLAVDPRQHLRQPPLDRVDEHPGCMWIDLAGLQFALNFLEFVKLTVRLKRSRARS